MKLSLEIPLKHIPEFLPLTDFSFLLAHLVLEKAYPVNAYLPSILLDNSMYELKDQPLEIEQLVEAAKRCRPQSVIAPDWMNDSVRTLQAAADMKGIYPGSVGGVVQGADPQERIECFYTLQKEGFSPICFPFRTPRNETIGALLLQGAFKSGEWYHLLGLQDLSELSWRPPGVWSVDTAKPFKSFRLDKAQQIRGHGILDVHKKLTPHERALASWNIAYMRKLIQRRYK